MISSDAAAFFRSAEKFRMATYVLERREQLRPVLKAAVDAEALKQGASREEVSHLHDELARGAPVLERLIADGLAGRFPAALREKREALRQRRIRTRDVATLAQIGSLSARRSLSGRSCWLQRAQRSPP